MQTDLPGFWARLWLAVVLFWKLLVNRELAGRVRALVRGQTAAGDGAPVRVLGADHVRVVESDTVRVVEPEPVGEQREGADPTSALQLLAIMQREGRLLDFLQEDVTGFGDAEVGAAARVVHSGCKRALGEYFALEPVRREDEGAPVVLERGFDPTRTRITGNVVGEPPYKGRLAHHGWQVADIHLPTLAGGHDPRVVAPAEVEL
jgi:hypothetical protein